jgi:hypothetical protein
MEVVTANIIILSSFKIRASLVSEELRISTVNSAVAIAKVRYIALMLSDFIDMSANGENLHFSLFANCKEKNKLTG